MQLCVCLCPYWFSVFWSGGDHWWGLCLFFVFILGYGCYGRHLRHRLGALCDAIGRERAKGQTRHHTLEAKCCKSNHYCHFLNPPTCCHAKFFCVESSLLYFSYVISSFSCSPCIIPVNAQCLAAGVTFFALFLSLRQSDSDLSQAAGSNGFFSPDIVYLKFWKSHAFLLDLFISNTELIE